MSNNTALLTGHDREAYIQEHFPNTLKHVDLVDNLTTRDSTMGHLEYSTLQSMIADYDIEDSDSRDYVIDTLQDCTGMDERLEKDVLEMLKLIQDNASCFVFPKQFDDTFLFESECNDFNKRITEIARYEKTDKENILIDVLDITLDEINDVATSIYDDNQIETGEGEYLVLTESEANELAKDTIKESAWAFNADFIIAHSNALDHDDASNEIIAAIKEQCESGNNAMLKLIDDVDEFIEAAIAADGRGHFLSGYDGEELELCVAGTWYFIYRTN